MKPVLLLLAATGLVGAAPARRAAPYEAGGFEPSWQLTISRGRLTYDPGLADVAPISMSVPRQHRVRNGYRYVTRELTVDVRHVRCESYDGRTFADTVRVSGVVEAGCGGRPIAPSTLAYSSWDIDSVAGMRPPADHDTYRFEFREANMSIMLGCRDYSSTFHERRPILNLGPQNLMRNFCPMSTLERRLLAILRGPVRISFVDGDTLILTGPGGSIRLLPS